MAKSISSILSLILVILGCNSTDLNLNYKNSDFVAYNLIKVCVDTAISSHPEMNTANYVLDLSGISTINKKGAESFISEKNKSLPTTTEDSTLVGVHPNSYAMRVKKSMLIKIHSISDIEDHLVKVEMSKMISTYNILELTIYLKRYLSSYKIHSVLSKYINAGP